MLNRRIFIRIGLILIDINVFLDCLINVLVTATNKFIRSFYDPHKPQMVGAIMMPSEGPLVRCVKV